MSDDEWAYFLDLVASQISDWVGGKTGLITTMPDAEFEALSNSIKF